MALSISCPVSGCNTTFRDDLDVTILLSLIQLHSRIEHFYTAQNSSPKEKIGQPTLPSVNRNGSNEKIDKYKNQSSIKLPNKDKIYFPPSTHSISNKGHYTRKNHQKWRKRSNDFEILIMILYFKRPGSRYNYSFSM